MIEIITLRALEDNFIYAVSNHASVAIVDPGEAAPVLKFLEPRQLDVKWVLLTHHHPDHVAGAEALRQKFGAEIVCSETDRARIPFATRSVHDGEVFDVLGAEVRVIATPGHTRGHVAYHFTREHAVFVGDTLFSAGCGRLFEGTAEDMFDSLGKLKSLAEDTRVYFGHEYTLHNLEFVKTLAQGTWRDEVDAFDVICKVARSADQPTTPTTIAVEKRVNPFLRARDAAELAEWRELRNHW